MSISFVFLRKFTKNCFNELGICLDFLPKLGMVSFLSFSRLGLKRSCHMSQSSEQEGSSEWKSSFWNDQNWNTLNRHWLPVKCTLGLPKFIVISNLEMKFWKKILISIFPISYMGKNFTASYCSPFAPKLLKWSDNGTSTLDKYKYIMPSPGFKIDLSPFQIGQSEKSYNS